MIPGRNTAVTIQRSKPRASGDDPAYHVNDAGKAE